VTVRYQPVAPGVYCLEVSRPEVRNALDWETMAAIADAVEAAHTQDDLRVLILTGQGQTFIAGGDLKALHAYTTRQDGARLSRQMTLALNRLEALPCPVIAAINGPARGGGAEIALACDLRIMAEDADLGFVQVSLGLIPGWGGGQRLLRLVGYAHALACLATGEIIPADRALELGLANAVVPAGRAFESTLQLAQEISANPPTAVAAAKRLLQAGLYQPPAAAAAFEAALFPDLWASPDHLEAVERFFKRGSGA
jgi:enoyl-CoA hydratase